MPELMICPSNVVLIKGGLVVVKPDALSLTIIIGLKWEQFGEVVPKIKPGNQRFAGFELL